MIKSISKRKRSPNIDEKLAEKITKIIDVWVERRITWEALIAKIEEKLLIAYTRQALSNHARIKNAFTAKQIELRSINTPEDVPTNLQSQHIARLEAEIIRLKRENNNLLEQFNRWVYNGYLLRIDDKMLKLMNRSLPAIQRDRSEP